MVKNRALIISLVFIVSVFTVSGSALGEEEKSSLEEHKWALQFGIQENLTLGSFHNGNISFKRQLSPKSAIRFGISIHYSYRSDRRTTHKYYNDLSVVYQRYINPRSRAKFYWGIGPYLMFSYYYTHDSNDTAYVEAIEKQFGAGAVGIGGIEWFATSSISFHAEYNINLIYRWMGDTRERGEAGSDPDVVSYSSALIDFGNLSSVRFGISVYF